MTVAQNRVSPEGLSDKEAAARLRRYGPNRLPEAAKASFWSRVFEQFKSPLIYILLVALALDLSAWVFEGLSGWPLESLAIAAILLLNALLGVVQGYRAEAALERLDRLAAPQAWALRGGSFVQVKSAELVPGDVLRLESGARVPADGEVLRAEGLLVDESLLTGESLPQDKLVGDELFSGTLLARGQVRLLVTRTGRESAMGRLATMLSSIEAGATPLEKRMARFGTQVARWVLVLAALLLLLLLALEGPGRLADSLLFAVALAVAAVPEGLPAVLTTTLALGTERMARRKAVVRRLAAVEALGSVTVIATDKTGTVTENRLSVRALAAADEVAVLDAMTLANEAEAGSEVGDPLDLALLRYAEARDPEGYRANLKREPLSRRPFDALWKYMRVSLEGESGVVSYLKGAPEVLLERSTLTEAERADWRERVAAYGAEGFRTLALARAAGEAEDGLEFLGLALLWDPPRRGVAESVSRAREAGVRVLMITGDHPATALAVAQSVGIPGGRVLSDYDLERLSPERLAEALAEVNVFARVAPEHKLQLVAALQDAGEVVAMTGDGVNDAPALKRADVGVAMGRRGSDVAREVADLVLLDDNFSTIVVALEQGRSIYANIQKFIRFLFASNLSEVFTVMLGLPLAYALDLRVAGELFLPLSAAQILWINLVTDSVPALALAFDRNPEVMRRPPQEPSRPLLDRASTTFVLVSGLQLALVVLAGLLVLPLWGYSLMEARSSGLLLIILAQLGYAFASRRLAGRSPMNRSLLAASLAVVALQALALGVPAIRSALNLTPLDVPLLLWSTLGAAAVWLLSELLASVLSTRKPPLR